MTDGSSGAGEGSKGGKSELIVGSEVGSTVTDDPCDTAEEFEPGPGMFGQVDTTSYQSWGAKSEGQCSRGKIDRSILVHSAGWAIVKYTSMVLFE